MLSLRINYSGDRTRKTHIMNPYCASLDLSHLLVFRDFQQVLSICLFSEDRRAQRLAQPWLTFGNPAVGADMLSTSATSVSSEELYLGRLSCLSRSPSREKCPSVALPVTHHLQKSCQSSCLGVSSSPLAHSLWVWAAAAVRGTAWAVNSLIAGKHASLLLIFRCCTWDYPLLAVGVGPGGWNDNKWNIYTLFVSYRWSWPLLDCADSVVLPQKHPWKGWGWGHQVHSPNTL